jgi:hypothetical protein
MRYEQNLATIYGFGRWMQETGMRNSCEQLLPADAVLVLRDQREGGINNTSSQGLAAVRREARKGWNVMASSTCIQP